MFQFRKMRSFMKRHLINRIIPLVLCMILLVPLAATHGQSRGELKDGSEGDSETILLTRDRSTRIVGGDDAQEGAWAFMAALVVDGNDPYNTLFCGGSLIDPKWVVTAAHCVEGEKAGDITVLLGIYDLENDTEFETYTVKRIVMHPSYDSPTQNDNDIALLELTSAATAYGIIPRMTGSDALDGDMATVIGWGSMSGARDEFPNLLQQVDVPVASNTTCKSAYGDSSITDNMLCAGDGDGGKDSCQGDSGGPLVVQDGGTWKLAGIVSWGEGCAEPGFYGVYARVSRFEDFIGQYAGASSAPIVATASASAVTSDSAVLNGSVNPNGDDTTYYFEYGIEEAGAIAEYAAKTAEQDAGSGTIDQSVSVTISGLSSNTTYNYRIAASNGNGTSYGSNKTFVTEGVAIAPSVTTSPAASITSRSAVINGIVNPHGVSTTYYFEYGETIGYGSATSAESAGSNTSEITVTSKLAGLDADTTYHYRLVAESSIGETAGDDKTFATIASQPPTAVDDAVTTAMNTALVIDVLTNDSDPDNDDLSITDVASPTDGTAVPDIASNTITYTPNSGFTGVDIFVYTVSDGTDTANATVTITVGEASISIDSSDTPLTIPDDDADGAASTINATIGGRIEDIDISLNIEHGWDSDINAYLISPAGTQVTLFEGVGDRGEDFTDTIFDDEASTGIAAGTAPFSGSYRPDSPLSVLDGESITGNWKLKLVDTDRWVAGKLRSWKIQVSYIPVSGNQAPVAENDTTTTTINTAVEIDILANDYDLNGDALIPEDMTQPENGAVVLNADKTITYTPGSGFIGEDSFTYALSGGNSAMVTISVSRKDLVQNGDFEEGSPNTIWNDTSILFGESIYETRRAHSGNWIIWLAGGNSYGGEEIASIDQNVVIPRANSATLTFWLRIDEFDVAGSFEAKLGDDVVFEATEADTGTYGSWKEVTVDISDFANGNTHNLRFEVRISAGSGSTDFLLDDVSLTVSDEITTSSCPTNDTDPGNLPDVRIGNSVTIPLVGSNVDTWVISYNGIDVTVPSRQTSYPLEDLAGNATHVVISANGFGENQVACSHEIAFDLAFASPVIEESSLTPAGPYDENDTVTVEVHTTNAVSVMIDDGDALNDTAMTPAGDPDTTFSNTWIFDYTATRSGQLTARAANPNGETIDYVRDVAVNIPAPPAPAPPSGGGGGGGCYIDTVGMGLDIHTSIVGWLLLE